MPLYYCERCGKYFTPTGTHVRRSITARGEFQEPEDSVCSQCLLYNEIRLGADIIQNAGKDNERRFR